MQIFLESLRKVWSELEIRVLVLVSLALQSVLILIGNRRKCSSGYLLRFFLWFAYLSADWVATISLSVLSSKELQTRDDGSTNPKYVIMAFWAPFLLQHLGGPDNITAYSLEDNELWWRHFLFFTVQVVVAIYTFLKAWNSKVLNYLSIPMFVSGIYRFAERTWVLRSASSNCFRTSMFPRPDPGPNYARYMEEYCSRRDEGFRVSSGRIFEGPTVDEHVHNTSENGVYNRFPDAKNLQDAYTFFNIFKRLFADLILNVHDIVKSRSFFQKESNRDAVFQVIEIELGYVYDVFYTKAVVNYSGKGVISRLISMSLVIVVLVIFSVFGTHSYSTADVIITFILLAGAVFLELYAVASLVYSDRIMMRLSKCKSIVAELLYRAVSFSLPSKKKRWSNQIAQYNLISFSLKDKHPSCSFLQKALLIYETMEKHRYKSFEGVPEELKSFIFEQLLNKSTSNPDISVCKKLCVHRGEWILEKEGCLDTFGWSIKDAEFDQSILLWHIATDLCYHSDMVGNSFNPKRNSKLLSDYMLYLLVMRPFMLPNGIGQIRFQDTCAEATEFFEERKSIVSVNRACKLLLMVSTEIPPSEVKGDRSKSVLFEACKLAKDLQDLKNKPNWSSQKWELISQVWVEMLSYAASHCQVNQHAQQLRSGGELLTHVWLLMAHLGITEQFQISKGHTRAKLIVQ